MDNAAAHVYVKGKNLYKEAIDVGKYRTYGIIEKDGSIVKERYIQTQKNGFDEFLEGLII